MRVSIQFEVLGDSIDEVVENATSEWQKISGDDSQLPHDAEITIEKQPRGECKASVFIRTKVER